MLACMNNFVKNAQGSDNVRVPNSFQLMWMTFIDPIIISIYSLVLSVTLSKMSIICKWICSCK